MNLAVGSVGIWIEAVEAEGRKVNWKEVWCKTDKTLDLVGGPSHGERMDRETWPASQGKRK